MKELKDAGKVETDRNASHDERIAHTDELKELARSYMASEEEKQQGEYTLEDYYNLPEERRVELIDGVFYDMTAPSVVHQAILTYLFTRFYNFVEANDGECIVFAAPFDVQLDRDEYTMVQPDIVIICKRDRLTRKNLYGAPDMAVEVLSPSTERKDSRLKLKKYMKAGVREYWIVDPKRQKVLVYKNRDADAVQSDIAEESTNEKSLIYLPTIYDFASQVPVGIWDGKCVIDFERMNEKLEFLNEIA